MSVRVKFYILLILVSVFCLTNCKWPLGSQPEKQEIVESEDDESPAHGNPEESYEESYSEGDDEGSDIAPKSLENESPEDDHGPDEVYEDEGVDEE